MLTLDEPKCSKLLRLIFFAQIILINPDFQLARATYFTLLKVGCLVEFWQVSEGVFFFFLN